MRITKSGIKSLILGGVLFFTIQAAGQSAENLKVVKKAVKLNKDLEFVELAALFDTTGGKKINPFLLHYVWSSLRDKYGNFHVATTKTSYVKNNRETIIEEFEFDSGYVELKFTFSADHKIRSYLLHHEISKAELALEKKYKLPLYAKQQEIEVREVAFGNEPYIIKGEIALPKNTRRKDKLPAIVLVHGSGPGDRDEKQGPNRTFKDIAYGLANHGIAVLRYDKRTLTYAEECGNDSLFTVDKETTDDALLAAQFLRTQKNINPGKIIILGHSLGGMMLPRMALQDTLLAGIIFMAAPARSMPEMIMMQMDFLATLHPDKKDEYEHAKDDFRRIKEKRYDSSTKAQYLPFGAPPSYWLDLDGYRQTEVAKQIKIPMLFLQGSRDYQVTAEDFALWKQALLNNPTAKFEMIEYLNHEMIAGSGPPTPDEYKIPGNVSKQVIDDIVEWVNHLP